MHFTQSLADGHFNHKVKLLRPSSLFEIEAYQEMHPSKRLGYENEFGLHNYSDFPSVKTINLVGDKHSYPKTESYLNYSH